MSQRNRRRDPFKAVLIERQCSQKRRTHGHGIDGRTDVMHEARKRNFRGAYATTGRGLGFQHADFASGLGETDGGGEAVWSGADNNGVSAGKLSACDLLLRRVQLAPEPDGAVDLQANVTMFRLTLYVMHFEMRNEA